MLVSPSFVKDKMVQDGPTKKFGLAYFISCAGKCRHPLMTTADTEVVAEPAARNFDKTLIPVKISHLSSASIPSLSRFMRKTRYSAGLTNQLQIMDEAKSLLACYDLCF